MGAIIRAADNPNTKPESTEGVALQQRDGDEWQRGRWFGQDFG